MNVKRVIHVHAVEASVSILPAASSVSVPKACESWVKILLVRILMNALRIQIYAPTESVRTS
jgi:hypothetical protein